MKVKEMMTARSLRSCSPETLLPNAAKAMKAGNCGALPVINKKKEVVGIVTDRDICLSLTKQNKTPNKLSVKEVMSPDVQTVGVNEDLTIALQKMRTYKVGRLPVVDKEGKLKGILSLHNVLSKTISLGPELPRSAQADSVVSTVKALSDRYTSLYHPNGPTKTTRIKFSE